MIAFACASTDERQFRAHAARSIEVCAEDDSLLMRRHRSTPLDSAYNEMIATAAERDDLEVLVLVHEGLTIADRSFLSRIRGLLAAGDDVAVIGAGDETGASEVAAVRGDLIVLSGWACSELRVDPRFADSTDAATADLCFTARAGGKRVVAARFGIFRHPALESPSSRRLRVRAGVALRRKWDLDSWIA